MGVGEIYRAQIETLIILLSTKFGPHNTSKEGMQPVQVLNPRQVILFPRQIVLVLSRQVALFLRQFGLVLPSQGAVKAGQALFLSQAALVPRQGGMQAVQALNPRQEVLSPRQVVLVLLSQGVVQALFPLASSTSSPPGESAGSTGTLPQAGNSAANSSTPPVSSRDSPPKRREYTGRL